LRGGAPVTRKIGNTSIEGRKKGKKEGCWVVLGSRRKRGSVMKVRSKERDTKGEKKFSEMRCKKGGLNVSLETGRN